MKVENTGRVSLC